MPRNKMKRFEIQTGILWDNVVASMATESWEENEHDEDQEIRRVWLGTQMGLSPSGKYYQPFACSNLNPCPACNGTGKITLNIPVRQAKKARHRLDALNRQGDLIMMGAKKNGVYWSGIRRFNVEYANALREQLEPLATGKKYCERCNGQGSHEAAADERYWENLDAEAEERGFFIDRSEDGDSVFVAELRQKCEDEAEVV